MLQEVPKGLKVKRLHLSKAYYTPEIKQTYPDIEIVQYDVNDCDVYMILERYGK
jgi:hypothetical protein